MLMSLSAFAGGEWVFTDPPITQNPDGSVVRNPAASIRGDWTSARVLHGTTTPNTLPERLPGMGSRMEMLDYIVASNRLGMNIYVGLVIYEPVAERFELTTGKRSDGFASYADFLVDARTGLELVLARYATNNLNRSRIVYATLYVTYFNGMPQNSTERGNGMALLVANPVSRFADLSIERIMESLEPTDDVGIAQVIIPVPRLNRITMTAQVATDRIATLNWTESSGPILNSEWGKQSPKEWSTPTYLYLRSWLCEGTMPVRVELRTTDGSISSYTQFGDALADVQLRMLAGGTSIMVYRPRGASVEISSSPDLLNWVHEISIEVGSDPISVNLTQPLSSVHFFKGVAF